MMSETLDQQSKVTKNISDIAEQSVGHLHWGVGGSPERGDGAVLVRREALEQAFTSVHDEVADARPLRHHRYEIAQRLVRVHIVHT